jgi:uncharacterized protein YbaA (DUF1428 family)
LLDSFYQYRSATSPRTVAWRRRQAKFGVIMAHSITRNVSGTTVYKSRAHRDRVNAKVIKDKRLTMPKKMPFEVKRMLYGGFKVLVDA